ncbi:SDR family NAD(P)-dependent oxidoreductase [Paraburkholderia sp. GAS334]|uniref:SDR family NAD(P)-dependent oxidoreductase n=1 Tax=Paraburkholderia sp. GAS334 TaxID=3035131 RepID=UPI003D1FDEE6
MKRLAGNVAVITGGAGDIGRATAKLFAQEGAFVVLVDRDEASLKRVVAGLGSDAVSYVVGDVTSEAQVRGFVEATLARHGRIDTLFCNAGTEGIAAPVVDYPLEVFERVFAVNVTGVMLSMKYGLPVMQKQGSGSVIIASSIAGLRAVPLFSAYVASKHAVIGLMRSAVLETASTGVRINTIHPSPITGRMMSSIEEGAAPGAGAAVRAQTEAGIPAGRYGEPGEVAQLVLFLASDESRFCTGGTYPVDGGMSAT